MADITMPQLGETVTEGTIIKWLKKVGDTVAIDEPLFEVSTDKVDSEVPSPVNGTITEILIQEGETADVGPRLAVLGDAGAAPATAPAPAAEPTPAPAPAPAPAAEAPAPQQAPPPPPPPPPPAPAPEPVYQAPPPPPPPPPPPAPAPAPEPVYQAPPASAPAAAHSGNGVGTVVAVPSAPPVTNGSRGALLSPVVRRLIADHGIDPANIPGTGLGGRITREDVLGYIDTQKSGGSPAPAPAQTAATQVAPVQAPAPAPTAPSQSPAYVPPPAPTANQAPAPVTSTPAPLGVRDEVVPFSTIRRVTAEHMMRSIATSAHTLAAIEADFENVDRIRRERKDQFKAEEGVSLTYLPFVARAVIEVLRDYPHLNSSVAENALIVHHNINLGFAVDLQQEGLIVPVIQNADAQSLRGIARSIADLASRARSRKLAADDITGGTFTITNPGPFGTFMTVPIIAQPQVAILSTDGVKRKPVVVTTPDGSESIAIHSVGVLALSFDHRAVDGAYAASFLKDVAHVIETRDWSAEF